MTLTKHTSVIRGLTGLLACVFLAAGGAKLAGLEQVILPFERLGMPSLALLVGLCEIALAVALFIPRFQLAALLGLSATMLGAIGYHLTLDPDKAFLPGLVLLILCAVLTWFRRPQAA